LEPKRDFGVNSVGARALRDPAQRAEESTVRDESTWLRGRRAAVVIGIAAVGVYFLLPSGSPAQAVLYSAIGLSAAAALAFGPTRRLSGGERLPWLLLAAGVASFAVADGLFSYYEQTGATPFPSAADGLYLAAYPLLLAGVVLLGRGRGRRLALADAFVASGALAFVQWVFVMDAVARDESGVARVILLAYPAMDVLLAAALARLLFTPAWRAPALSLLVGAVLLMLVADEVYLGLSETYTSGSWVDAFWLLSYALFAATGLNASAPELREPADHGFQLGGARVLLLGGAPFEEEIVMWWNFVARTPEEIAAAREEWERGSRFGEVRGYAGPRLHAPALMHLAAPNPAS